MRSLRFGLRITPLTVPLIGGFAAVAFSVSAWSAVAEVADMRSRAVALIGVASYVNDYCSAFWSKPTALLARLASSGIEDPKHLPVQVWIDGQAKAAEAVREGGGAATPYCQAMFESFGGGEGGSIPFVFRKGQRAPANPFDSE